MPKNKQITVFKIKIIDINFRTVTFDLYVANKVDDTTYLNVKKIGGYSKGTFMLENKQFTDFAHRLIAYVYLDKKPYITDNILKNLWELRLNIFDKENPDKSKPVFIKYKAKLKKLGLIKKK